MPLDVIPAPVTHGISVGIVSFAARGGHAVAPRALRAVNVTTRIRDVVTTQIGYALSVPKLPKGCTASTFHLTPWAKQHGFKASQFVTFWCSK